MTTITAKTVILKDFLDEGIPGPEHFIIDEKPFPLEEKIASLKEGEIIVEAKAFSADPYLRGTIKSAASGLGGVKPGGAMSGFITGKVVASKNLNWSIDDYFGASLPFTTIQVVPAEATGKDKMWKLTGFLDDSTITRGVGILGMPGSTAYGGLIDILQPKQGETLFVSAASGAVGGLVGMIAKHVYGCKVIGSCGGPEKCAFIKDYYGFDHAIDYKKYSTKEELVKALKEVAPEGIDMYYENVGGIHFEAAMALLRRYGRVAVCGWISEYNQKQMAGVPFNPATMIYTQQRIEGFLCHRWLYGEKGNFLGDMSQWIQEGKVKVQETYFDGIENWPVAFQALFTGRNTGKVVIRL